MKKILLSLLILFGTGFCLNSFGQTFNGNIQLQVNTRTVYLFISDLQNSSDANIVDTYLETFDGKIFSANTTVNNKMCVVKLKNMNDHDLVELVLQKGFTAFIKSEMPPAGFQYVYNPDGTWKLKEL
jgi:hypothetical protein